MQQISLTLTPWNGGDPLELPSGELEQDAIGNLTIRWTDAILDGHLLAPADLAGYLSTNVDVHRNRAGTFVAITDPLGRLLDAEWTEYDPWTGSPSGPYTMRCVAANAGRSAAAGEARLSVVLYRAHYRYERVSGLLEGG